MCLSCSLRFQPTYLFDVRSLPWEQGLSSSFKRSERSKRRAAQTPNAQAWHTPSGGLCLGEGAVLVGVLCALAIGMSPSPTKRVRRGRHSDGRVHPLGYHLFYRERAEDTPPSGVELLSSGLPFAAPPDAAWASLAPYFSSKNLHLSQKKP